MGGSVGRTATRINLALCPSEDVGSRKGVSSSAGQREPTEIPSGRSGVVAHGGHDPDLQLGANRRMELDFDGIKTQLFQWTVQFDLIG